MQIKTIKLILNNVCKQLFLQMTKVLPCVIMLPDHVTITHLCTHLLLPALLTTTFDYKICNTENEAITRLSHRAGGQDLAEKSNQS